MDLLSLKSAAHTVLGWPSSRASARRLGRYLRARTPDALLRGPGKRTTYYTTRSLLEFHCPEFFDHRKPIVELVAEHVEHIYEELRSIRAHLDDLDDRDKQLAMAIKRARSSPR